VLAIASLTLGYAGIALELGLLVFLLTHGKGRRLGAVCIYLALMSASDGLRSWELHAHGAGSQGYYYTYWLTDIALALAAFLLICFLFRRACAHNEELWSFLRLTLTFVFLLIFAVSCLAVFRNYDHLFTSFIYNFPPDLYLACLVLNTILYLQLQRKGGSDPELQLLVSGLGIQFAGIAGGLAFVYLSGQKAYAQTVFELLSPLCAWGMVLVWSYAVVWPLRLAARFRAMSISVAGQQMSPQGTR
jgi:hypothetical protein